MNIKFYICCFLSICLFYTCKEVCKDELIKHELPNEYYNNFTSVLNYIKTSTGNYDTLVSLSVYCGKKYIVQNATVDVFQTTVTCNR